MKALIYDIGGTFVKWAIVNKELEILEKGEFVSFTDDTDQKCQNMFKRIAEHSLEIKGKENLIGIGISSACVINMDTGEVIGDNPVFKGYVGFNIVKFMEEQTGLKTIAMNDGNSGVLGEYVKGSLKGVESTAVMIVLGTGIGSGILHKGEVFGGHNYWAGEVGTILVGDKPWEDVASVRVFTEKVSAELGKEVDGRYIFSNLSDPIINKYYKEWLKLIAIGIKDVFHAFGPKIILLGGGISANDTFLIEELMEEVKPLVNEYVYNAIKIEKASLGNDANILGVASLLYK